jgi:hypothetical protein
MCLVLDTKAKDRIQKVINTNRIESYAKTA